LFLGRTCPAATRDREIADRLGDVFVGARDRRAMDNVTPLRQSEAADLLPAPLLGAGDENRTRVLSRGS
jgi:hypothetical protein